MPTQVYECKKCGERDYYYRWEDEVTQTRLCDECGEEAVHIIKPLAGGAHFRRTWNEQANDARRDPYTQAKAQAEAVYNQEHDQGLHPNRITEEGLQVAAKAIDEDNKGLRPKRDVNKEAVKAARKQRKARDKEKKFSVST